MIVGPFEAKGVGQMSKMSNEGTERSSGIFGIFNDRTRFIVLALTTICLTLGMCNGTALHFTVICMKQSVKEEGKNLVEMTATEAAFPPSNDTATINYSSSSQNSFPTKIAPINPLQMPMFTFEQQGWLFSALALGTLLSSLATDFLCNLLGFRLLTTLFGLASGLATFGTPFASWLPIPLNFYALFIARLAQGFVLALSFVAAGKLSARWCPISESTLFIGVVSTHFTLGRMITMPMAGLLCESHLGWPSVYFLLGAFTVAFFLIFFWFFRDFPEMHRKVSHAELMRISSGRGEMENGGKRKSNVAENREWKYYMELLFDPAVWALFISDFGIVLGNQLFAQYGPIYLKNAIGLSTQRSGFIAALPFLLAAIVATIVSRLCDQFLGGKPKLVVILTTAFPQYLMAICYLALAFLPISQPFLIQSFFTLVIIFPGIWFVGIVKHVQLIAQNRPQSLLALNSAVAYFFIMLVPTFVNLLIDQEDAADNEKWGRIFKAVAVAQMFSALVVQISVQFFKNNKN